DRPPRSPPHRGRPRSVCVRAQHVPERDAAADDAGNHRGRDPDVHPGDRRLRDAGPARRGPDDDDREDRPGHLHERPRLAVRLGAWLPAHDRHARRNARRSADAPARGPGVRGERNRWLSAFAVATYAFLFAPIVVLIIFSFNVSRRNFVWLGFTTSWYPKLL